MDAIRAGTSVAALTIPDDDVGAIEPGNRADVVVLDGNPLDDISALRDVQVVYEDREGF